MKRNGKNISKIVGEEKTRDEAIDYWNKKGESYKVEIINDLPPDAKITFYTHRKFTDLCKGGHLDSTAGYGSDPVAPGADDNASGVSVTNEVIRVMVEGGYRPARTIKFIAFAAEEVGLRGSSDIAAAFQKEGVAVEGMLNLDMTNYKGSQNDIYFVTDNTNSGQNAFLEKLVTAYTDYTVGTFRCGYGCSDHASWTKRGFPASLPFESLFNEHNPFIHKATDTLAQTGGGAEHSVKFAKLAVAYAVEMAK